MRLPRGSICLLLVFGIFGVQSFASRAGEAYLPASPSVANAEKSGELVRIAPKESDLRFQPAPEGWQRDVAWQVFGFRGETEPPQFFYRIPDDEAEAKALIDAISRSALVGRVQLIATGPERVATDDAVAGSPVGDIRGAWDVQWQGMGRSAPWIEKTDSAEVLQSMIRAASTAQSDGTSAVATTGALEPESGANDEPASASELMLGINVPLRDLDRHAVGRGTLETVRER